MMAKELGRTGVLVAEVGIGTYKYCAGVTVLRKGLESGGLFIDTAESYGSEAVVGAAIQGLRDRVFVATKVPPQNLRRADLLRSVDASLRRLGISSVDLLQIHSPNPSVPIEETMGAMVELVDAGKVRFIGVSNFSVSELDAARRALPRYDIVSNQVRYNIIDRTIEKDLLSYCRANHILVIAYSPLARGLDHIRDCDPNGVIDELARFAGRSPAQIVLNWCLCKDGVVVIPRGNSELHMLENCAASGWRLNAGQLSLLDANIQWRHRGQFEMVVGRYMPAPLKGFVFAAVQHLPRSLRRRIA